MINSYNFPFWAYLEKTKQGGVQFQQKPPNYWTISSDFLHWLARISFRFWIDLCATSGGKKSKTYVFTRHVCGSPFVQSKRRGFRCLSRHPELWLPHTADRVEALVHRHAGRIAPQKKERKKKRTLRENCIRHWLTRRQVPGCRNIYSSYHMWGADGSLIAFLKKKHMLLRSSDCRRWDKWWQRTYLLTVASPCMDYT